MNESEMIFVFTYKDAKGQIKHYAIYEKDKKSAMNVFNCNKEPTDRLIGEAAMTRQQYKEWKKKL